MNVIERIKEKKVIAICRRLYGENLYSLSQALLCGGVGAIEITFDQSDPDGLSKSAEAISMIAKEFQGNMIVGAGTVITPHQVDIAAEAGARYIISPNTNSDVIKRTKQLNLVSIPGAMTPTEILSAYDLGADFVKLFPSGWLGFSYIKDITAPISHVPLIATGGVNEKNFEEYLKLGFVGAGVSSYFSDKALIAKGDFETISCRAAEMMRIANRY